RDRFKELITDNDLVTLNFWGNSKEEVIKINQIEKITLTELQRRGKKLDPYHFFVTIQTKKKDIFNSTELPASKVLDFIDDYNSFIKDNEPNLNIQNEEIIIELLGPELIEILQSLRKQPKPASS
ncbi:MAG: hypothetical protein AB7V50_03630, partial [Vampirovibrionia bacterium]